MFTETHDHSFLKSVKGKVIFGFLVGVAALTASYFISKDAFDEVEEMVYQIATPDERLRLINEVFQDILLLNQLQTELQTIANSARRAETRKAYQTHSDLLRARLDTLAMEFSASPGQLVRLDSIRFMLDKRASILDAYLRERRGMMTNSDLQRKADSLSVIIATSPDVLRDSTIIKTEKLTTTTITTTVDKEPTAIAKVDSEEEDKKGFWGKLFKGKKPKEDELIPDEKPVVIKQEEVKVSIDTLTIAANDSAIQKVGEEVKSMATVQMARATRFFERERQLQTGEILLMGKLMELMREVENDALASIYRDNEQIRQTLGESIKNIGFILLLFLSLTALLGFWIFADITRSTEYRKELILAKEEAMYHSEAKQRFLANMSHEIRTPLQSIIGYSELLKDQENPDKGQLEIIHKSSVHLLHLVNEILDYSRIVSDSFEFVEESFELEPVLTEVIETLSPQASAKGLALNVVNKFPSDTYFLGDAFRLKQILHNLVGNAIKFTKKGKVDLIVEPVEKNNIKEIRIEVRDTGIGLKPEQVKRIFNQFEQGHAGITPEYGGTGLGLSIVKALVTGQNGRINVLSKPNEFTSFIIHLPYKKGEKVIKQDTEVEVKAMVEPFYFKGKVWIIDDDKYILSWLKTVLELHQIEVRAFSSPVEASSTTWDPEVSVVFIDMRMPQMTGTELCEILKKKADVNVRFVACTAMALPEERAGIIKAGFEEILMKPIRKSELLNVLMNKTEESLPDHNENSPINTADRPEVLFDLSNLEALTMGDEQLLRDSLEQFVDDTLRDLTKVEELMDNGDNRATLRELFHRLAGRTAQIGAVDLGNRMRHMELQLAGSERVDLTEVKSLVLSGYEVVDAIQGKYVS